MNDDELKKLFSSVEDSPGDEAREKALSAALQAFDDAHGGEQKRENATTDQGSAEIHRLTPDTQPVGSKPMNHTITPHRNQHWIYSGLASAALLVVSVFVVLQLPQHSGFEPIAISEQEKPEAVTDATIGQPGTQTIEEVMVTARRRNDTAQQPLAMADAARPQPSSPAKVASLAKEQSLAPTIATRQMTGGLVAEADIAQPQPYRDVGRDQFETVDTNPVKRVSDEPVSTFSIDVDTASYSFVRRQLNQGVLPQKAAVRLEEMVNYFPYDYPLPSDRNQPFSTNVTVIDSPWKAGNKLVHIGIKGYELQGAQPRSNLVLLLDVSGSMNSPDKLPLVKQSMMLLLSRLHPQDTVAIVVYAGAAGTVLEPTAVSEKDKILAALNRLSAGGSTAGGAGIKLAYQLAESHFIEDGVNRIILATDGDFNVGINNREELKGFVERKRESGVFLSVLGFGQGNYHDQLMQALAQNGNGIAAYIDTLGEAQKVLVDEATSSLFPIASDVKIQVEFNPATVSEYRLLGYETRMLAQEDFNNDAVDAGDIGAGHTVTAIYEITPRDSDSGLLEPSRYAESKPQPARGDEYGFLKLRYKLPGEKASKLVTQPIVTHASTSATSLREARFATAVAGFAQLLKDGKYTGDWRFDDALELAQANRGQDNYGYRSELVQLIRKAQIAEAIK